MCKLYMSLSLIRYLTRYNGRLRIKMLHPNKGGFKTQKIERKKMNRTPN